MPVRAEGEERAAFDPSFDDTTWTDGWRFVPVALAPPATHVSGYRIERVILRQAVVFGRAYRLSAPFEGRALYDPHGRLWMSNTPQEHIMMYNNGRRSAGHVLVGGLGLSVYPQYAVVGAAGQATRFTVVEASTVVRDLVEPALRSALRVPLQVTIGDVEERLTGAVTTRYDTIFLDTWDTLDAARLPAVNRLRDRALRHLTPGGRVLLWGYRWMVRLFEDACRMLLAVPPDERSAWLSARDRVSPQVAALLEPVAERYRGQAVEDVSEALAWCRKYVVHLVA